MPRERERDARYAASQREQHALHERLARQARASCSERSANRQISSAGRCPGEHQACDVGCRDEQKQHGADRDHGHRQPARRIHPRPLQRGELDALSGVRPLGVGVGLGQHVAEDTRGRPGHVEGSIVLEAADDPEPMRPGALEPLRIHDEGRRLHRHPGHRGPGEPVEARAGDADDLESLAVDGHVPARDVGIGAETLHPDIVGQHRNP